MEEVVRKKYHILKTSDNFYIYKMDIKECLEKMREDETIYDRIGEEGLDILDRIERSFDDIERRIANMDKENTKYIRAHCDQAQLSPERGDGHKGACDPASEPARKEGKEEERIRKTASRMNLSLFEILSEKSLYKRRKPKKDFVSQLEREEEPRELSKEDVLKLKPHPHQVYEEADRGVH